MKRSSEQTKPLVTAPKTVLGYHGCTAETAQRILTEGRFAISTNTYDWLGEGAYFWEYAPYRALEWAMRRCRISGGEPVVLGATIRLGRCLNLLDIEHSSGLSLAYNQFAENLGKRRMPRNTETGAHFLDREVIDLYCRIVELRSDYAYQTVRGCYPEGEPVFTGSKILQRTHVQIAVRDKSCVSRLHMVEFP